MEQDLFGTFFNDIFDIIDDFELFRNNFNSKKNSMARSESETNRSYLKLYKKLAFALKRLGIEQIKCEEGELFNPYFHDAKDTTMNNKYKENCIVKIISAGYQKNGKILRPVSVIVNN